MLRIIGLTPFVWNMGPDGDERWLLQWHELSNSAHGSGSGGHARQEAAKRLGLTEAWWNEYVPRLTRHAAHTHRHDNRTSAKSKSAVVHTLTRSPEFAIGIGHMRLPRRRHRTKSPRTARRAGLCTKGRRWRLGWLVYAPEGPPSAWAGPCRFSRCQNSRKCTFPLNRVKLACCFAKKVSPRDPPAFPRALVWPSGLSHLSHGLSPARQRLEGRLLKIAHVCA